MIFFLALILCYTIMEHRFQQNRESKTLSTAWDDIKNKVFSNKTDASMCQCMKTHENAE